jgi:hypothetical protein
MELYPEYEIRIHDDKDILDFIDAEFPQYRDVTIRNMPQFIMTVDTVRYMWMHTYGGIYCDMDVFFQKRLEFEGGAMFIEREWTWPEDKTIISSVHNCFFGSVPGHPVWSEILDGIAQNVAALPPRAKPARKRGRIERKLRKLLFGKSEGKNDAPPVFNTTGPNAISKIITQRGLTEKFGDLRILAGAAVYQRGLSKGDLAGAYFVHETAGSWKE